MIRKSTCNIYFIIAIISILLVGFVFLSDCQEKKDENASGDSLFQIHVIFHDQTNRPFRLQSLAGKPAIVAMFYTRCRSICPRITADMRRIESLLQSKTDVSFVMISIDPDTDTPETLLSFSRKNGLDGWILLNGKKEDVRLLSAALNFRYAKENSGEFNHSRAIVLLDAKGIPVYRESGLQENGKKFKEEIDKLL